MPINGTIDTIGLIGISPKMIYSDITILESIKKTNRVIVAHEDHLTSGFGSEIVSQISDKGFEFLDAPVKRVASKDVHIAYSPNLEDEILVQTSWIENQIEEILNY